jgi:hypothetical protein
MRAVLSVFSAITITLALAGPLHAGSQCGEKDGYGKEAADQAQRADDLKCGFGGKDDPRFWNDPKGHARWCVGAKQESVNAEKAGRAHSLSKCEMCRNYSNQANAAAQQSRTFRCGFDGARWSSGDGGPNDGHFSWCMNQREHDAAGLFTFQRGLSDVKQSRLDPETNARTADLKACKAKISERFSEAERKPCRDYASDAVALAKINVSKKCGATPVSRWSLNEREHFEACLAVGDAGKSFLADESEIRAEGVRVCTEKGLKLSGDGSGKPINPNFGRKPKSKEGVAGTKPMEGHPTPPKKPAGGSDKSQDNAGTSKGSSTKSTSSGGGGCAGSAMDRLGGGGCGPAGGDNLSYPGGTPGSKSKPTTGGAAVITPAATATPPAAAPPSGGGAKCFGRSCGSGSQGDTGFYHPAPPKPVK